MKVIFKHSCLLLIIAAVMVSSFPVFNAGDMNHDQSVDLQDIVLCARSIVGTATVSGDFVKSFNGFYAAAQVVAGFKHVIQKDRDPGFSSTGQQAYLLPLHTWMPRLCVGSLSDVNPNYALTMFYQPEPRPPCLFA